MAQPLTEAEEDAGITYLQRLWGELARRAGVEDVDHLFAVSAANEVAGAARPGVAFYLDMNAFMLMETQREDLPDFMPEWVAPLGESVTAAEPALRGLFAHALPRMRALRDRDAGPDLA
jgi:hypothetical protein